MAISINGEEMNSPSMIPSKYYQVLSCISDGLKWLEISIQNSSISYEFDSAYELVSNISQGLHGTRLVTLGGCRIGVRKIEDFDESDVTELVNASKSSQWLWEQRILTDKQCKEWYTFSRKNKISTIPYIASAGIDELYLLYEHFIEREHSYSADELLNTAMKSESIPSFIANCFVAEYCSSAKVANADELEKTLESILYPALSGMTVASEPCQHGLQIALKSWQAKYGELGFTNMASGVPVCLQGLRQATKGGDDKASIQRYITRSQNLISSSLASSSVLSQSGRDRFYLYETDFQNVTLHCSSENHISIYSYFEPRVAN